ncbi:uncharacterized protein METZ01_LOCUS417159, partial [marine metagenome]
STVPSPSACRKMRMISSVPMLFLFHQTTPSRVRN